VEMSGMPHPFALSRISPPRLQAGRDDIRPLPAHSLHGAG
jgi:hypothetical protein